MRTKFIRTVLFTFTIVFAAYAATDAQVVDKIKDKTVKAVKKTVEVTKDVAGKTKDAVVDGTDKTVEVSKDVAGETKDITVEAAKNVGSKTKKIGGYTVDTTENVVGSAYEGGRWLTVTAWDGTKWVSKRTWFAARKAAEATRDFVVGDETKKP